MRRILQVAPVILALCVGACDKTEEAATKDGATKSAGKQAGKDGASAAKKDGAKPDPSTKGAAVATTSGAHERLPDDCHVAVSVNIKSLLGHAKVKSEIVPILQAAIDTAAPKQDDFKEFQAFLKQAKLELSSAQSVAVCMKDVMGGKPNFAVAIAGTLGKDALIPALKATSKDIKPEIFKEIDGHPAIADSDAIAYQMDDGTFAAGSDEASVAKLKTKNKNYQSKYSLDTGKFLAFYVGGEVMTKLPPMGPQAPKELGGIKSVSGYISVEPPEAKITVTCADAAAATTLAAWATVAKGMATPASNNFGEKDAVDGATAIAKGADVVITVPLPIDKGISAVTPMLKDAAKSI